MELSNITVGFQCYPHTDTYECGRLLTRLLHEQHTTGKPLHQALVQLPWHIAPAFGVTLSGPAHDVMLYNQQLVKEDPALRDITFFQGFPYSDVPFAGASVTAVAETADAARQAARKAARYAWSRRKDFLQPINSAQQAMDLAELAEGPVVINERSDKPGGGTPGAGPFLLRELLKRDLPGSVYGFIRDAEVEQQALAAGVGAALADLILGWAMYAPVTLLIKGITALLAGLAMHRAKKAAVPLALICCLLVPLGYFLFETVLLTAPVAAVNVLPNAFQAIVGASLGTLVGRHLKKLYKRKD